MSDYEFDPSPRDERGVKCRLDGQGDGWANAHRACLGKDYYFQDMDVVAGLVAFAHSTGERLFLEYVPDGYENRAQTIRRFGLVALFDRKSSEAHAFSAANLVSRALYLHICRVVRVSQPAAPKFFYVIGAGRPPWRMIELDIHTGQRTGVEAVLDTADWSMAWGCLGLTGLRRQLKRWLEGRGHPPVPPPTGAMGYGRRA